jgi:acetamidase/formamidase
VADHTIDPTRVHHEWDLSLEPALRIASGDTVHHALRMTGTGMVHEGARIEETSFSEEGLYRLSGPVFVRDAAPGDTLRVDVLDLEPGDWGWTAILPGGGLLPDLFPEPFVRTFDLRDGETIQAAPNVRIPMTPFLGTMGTHPGEPAHVSSLPPHRGGGNIDARHLTRGSTLWLPVWVDGALFSCGDAHAAQGDGEVCLTGVECDMRATLRFTLEQRTIPAPMFRTAGPLLVADERDGHVGTMGIHADLHEGARLAVRAMIEWLQSEHGLDPHNAFVVCSLAGDLKILEIVDAGVYNVGFTLPRSIFGA